MYTDQTLTLITIYIEYSYNIDIKYQYLLNNFLAKIFFFSSILKANYKIIIIITNNNYLIMNEVKAE